MGQEQPTVRFSSYRTRSVDESHDAIASHYYDLSLDVPGSPDTFLTEMSVVELGELTVGELSFGTEVAMEFVEPRAYHVALPLTGRFRLGQGRAAASYATPDRALFLDPDRPVQVDEWSRDCRALAVKLDRAAVHRRLEGLLGRPLGGLPRFAPYVDITRGPGLSWANLARWSLSEKDVPGGLLAQPLIRASIERTLLEGVLYAAGHNYREELEIPGPRLRPAPVKRVMDVVHDRPAEPYDATSLAAIAQVGVRTLQDAFRRHVGMSPMSYVNEVRLRRVREQLRTADPRTTTVTDVAYAWGFSHLGRFAQRYRTRFGESPSQTLRTE
ncbi:AraC family transcriptional regulator [Streptomyces adustus]|uniref:AraC family transcriptional regulator n=1 Tax=Streptomyces adustus TaxID=1609272 RepID=UPI00371B2D7C